MLSGILLSLKKRQRNIKTFSFILLFVFISACNFFLVKSFAASEELPRVSIKVIYKDPLLKHGYNAEVKVTFNDMSLYNDSISFSYHIYETEKGLVGEAPYFENLRQPVILDENNSAVFPVEIDLSSCEYKDAYIQFDLVDAQNNYWLSLTDDPSFDFEMLHYSNDKMWLFLEKMEYVVMYQPFILAGNILVFIAIIAALIIVKKKRILTFKRSDSSCKVKSDK